MALPTYTVTGVASSTLNLNAAFAVQAGSLPPVQTAYLQNVLGAPSITTQALYQTSGTGAGQVQRIIVASGSLAATATASVDLSSAADIIGVTTTMAHVREVMIINDGQTAFSTADVDILTWDLSVANTWGTGGGATGPVQGTNPKIDVPAGSVLRFAKPFGSVGWTVTSGAKIIGLATSGNAHTINYRVIVAGD